MTIYFPVPYPDLEKSVDCTHRELLAQQLNPLHMLLCNGGNEYLLLQWKYHAYQVAEYAKLVMAKLKSHDPALEHTIELVQEQRADTGFPEWWGGWVHNHHRSLLLYFNHDYYSKYNWRVQPEDWQRYPEVNLSKRLESLQPILRKHSQK